MTAHRVALLCTGVLLLMPGLAAAEDGETYEERRSRELLQQERLEPDPSPHGKRIAWVRVVRDAVFAEDELWPVWPNLFHKTTRDRTIRRELLLRPGDLYDQLLKEESERILRSLSPIAIARITAVKTAREDEVGLVVHTRDLWSLRLETGDFSLNRQVQTGTINLVERNLNGNNKALGFSYSLGQGRHRLMQTYSTRRVLGSDLTFAQNAGLYLRRRRGATDTALAEAAVTEAGEQVNVSIGARVPAVGGGKVEGGFAAFSLSRPFFRLADRYAYAVSASFSQGIDRQFGEDGLLVLRRGAVTTPFAWVHRTRSYSLSVGGTLRRGYRFKQSLGVSFGASGVKFSPVAETSSVRLVGETYGLEDSDPAQAQAFVDAITGVARRQIGPTVTYGLFIPDYRYYENLNTYGQTEAVRAGPSVSLSASAPQAELGSSTDAWLFSAAYGYNLLRGRYIFSVNLGGSVRWEEGALLDQTATASTNLVTPFYGPVRVSAAANLRAERNDTSGNFVTAGYLSGLPGYPQKFAGGIFGGSFWTGSISLISKPLEWEALHIGAVLFYKVVSIYKRTEDMFRRGSLQRRPNGEGRPGMFHSLGVSVRFMFPQFSRTPYDVTYGFPASHRGAQPAGILNFSG